MNPGHERLFMNLNAILMKLGGKTYISLNTIHFNKRDRSERAPQNLYRVFRLGENQFSIMTLTTAIIDSK